jgi:hypothetical protein
MQDMVSSLIRLCNNLQRVELQVANAEKEDCLSECIQGALAQATSVKEVAILEPTSIRSLAIVYNLPYRLRKLHIIGLFGYKMKLWESPDDYIDVEEVILERSWILDWDVHFFFRLMEHESASGPPIVLRLLSTICDIDWIPDQTAKNLSEIDFHDAQKLLKLDLLEKFATVSRLGLSFKHNFVSLTLPLEQIVCLDMPECKKDMAKTLRNWLDRGLLAKLECIHFDRDAFWPASLERALVERLDAAIRARHIICRPLYPIQMYEYASNARRIT